MLEVKKFVIFLTESIWANIWYAYEKDVMEIINEMEFLKIGEFLSNNPNDCVCFELTVLYPKKGIFEKYFLPILKEDTFVCQRL